MDLGFQVDVSLAKPKEAATPMAKKAAQKGYPIVAVFGGDGTIEAVARGLVGTKARLAIIPNGTENNVARSLGIPTDLEAACALIKEKPKRRIDVGRIKTKKNKNFYFIEVAAVGLTAALYPEGKDLKEDITHGNLSGLVEVAKTLIHYPMPTLRMTIDKESKLKVNSMLAVISACFCRGRKARSQSVSEFFQAGFDCLLWKGSWGRRCRRYTHPALSSQSSKNPIRSELTNHVRWSYAWQGNDQNQGAPQSIKSDRAASRRWIGNETPTGCGKSTCASLSSGG
jgi:hypothetical protein